MILDPVTPTARLALDTIERRPTDGIPTWLLNIMEHAHLERLAGAEPGAYARDPEGVYLACQRAIGVCLIDQWIPRNPLSMGERGFEGGAKGATTGAERIELDGIVIDSPEAVVEHLERFEFPRLAAAAASFNPTARRAEILAQEIAIQDQIGEHILKAPYGFLGLPCLAYTRYGYVHYLTAFALYPEVFERHFALQADLAEANNRAAAPLFADGHLPRLYRMDHDMADSRGTLVRIEDLDRLWFPHFARCIEPVVKAGALLLWHCDGNLMDMVPRLLDLGFAGFQGFQYEDGMDYERICRLRTRDGEELLIIAGVSVTTTLPHGRPEDVRRELDWLVRAGPRRGLFLGGSSSIVPGTPWDNLVTFIEGLQYYRLRGRR